MIKLRLLKIRPWPFTKDEKVELFWLCSPYLNENHNWMFRAAFKDSNNKIKDIEIPWGSLPSLTIGQGYKNGLPYETLRKGKIEEIDISGFNEYEICNGFDMPHNLYYLYKNSLYGRQKVCKFTLKDRTFYVPCIESIRFFLAPSKTLAYQLLKPQGLDFLIESIFYPYKNTVQVNLSSDYPVKLANDDNVIHLLWLMTNRYARITWDYVFQNLYKKASVVDPINPTNTLSTGIPIESRPPYMEKGRLTIRGFTVNKSTLVLEIMNIVGLNMKHNYISYSHPSFYRSEQTNEPKTAKRVGTREDYNYEMDEHQSLAKKRSNTSAIDNAKLRYGFEGYHEIRKSSSRVQKQRTGKHQGNNITQCSNTNMSEIVTTQDWAYGGDINPIEFKLVEVDYTSSTKGLEEFIQAIKYINENYKELNITLDIVYLPEGKTFSYYPIGYRRNCAIVKVESENRLPCYVIEIGREDNWSISTLLVHGISNFNTKHDDEKLFDRILKGVINNNGHWDKSLIYQEQNYKFEMMKHGSNNNISRWASRIISRITKYIY